MHCYVRDFGLIRLAVCEERMKSDTGVDRVLVAQDTIKGEPTPETWARLGAALARSGEIVEAQ